MNVVVHKYLTGVRKVQRNIRDFIACKHSKISTLAILWSRLEKQYVKQMLEKRKLAKRSTGALRNAEYYTLYVLGCEAVPAFSFLFSI